MSPTTDSTKYICGACVEDVTARVEEACSKAAQVVVAIGTRLAALGHSRQGVEHSVAVRGLLRELVAITQIRFESDAEPPYPITLCFALFTGGIGNSHRLEGVRKRRLLGVRQNGFGRVAPVRRIAWWSNIGRCCCGGCLLCRRGPRDRIAAQESRSCPVGCRCVQGIS